MMVAVIAQAALFAYCVQGPLEFSFTTATAGVKKQEAVRLSIDPSDRRMVTVRNTLWKAPMRLRLNEAIQYAHPEIRHGFICVTVGGKIGYVAYSRTATNTTRREIQKPFFPAPTARVMGKIVSYDSYYSLQACVDDTGTILISNTAMGRSCRVQKVKGKIDSPKSMKLKIVPSEEPEVEAAVSYTSNGKGRVEKFPLL